jgi:hypothetical protein
MRSRSERLIEVGRSRGRPDDRRLIDALRRAHLGTALGESPRLFVSGARLTLPVPMLAGRIPAR